ncbi:MAG TPA: triose-phosphate isomerase [Candidatus Methylomirabilis sp.]|nr:triose-phosphate isomerase [Candidatus Methylomirabilis sp.]
MHKLIIANWKMYYGPVKAGGWVRAFRRERLPKDLDVAIAVPSVSLAAARSSLGRATIPALAAQNAFWENEGAYTGEISPPMLQEFGVALCLVGHSERRKYLCETDDMVARKAAILQKAGIVPVICVGETDAERKKGSALKIIRAQVTAAIANVKPDGHAPPVFAYEPVWAIGTGKACIPQDAKTAHAAIRETFVKKWGPKWAHEVRVLYGGSVDARNIAEYMTTTGIDGALVGGASLDPRGFGLVCRAAVPA